PATVDEHLDLAEALGMPFVGSADPAGFPSSRQKPDWDRSIEDWNLCAERAATRGIPIYAHAHWTPWDFLRDCGPPDPPRHHTRPSGVRGIEYWLGHTDPTWFGIQMDTYWAYVASTLYPAYTAVDGDRIESPFDPRATVLKHLDRHFVFHAKDGI